MAPACGLTRLKAHPGCVLTVQRYSVQDISTLLGPGFELRMHQLERHRTPLGTEQQFLYGWWQTEA